MLMGNQKEMDAMVADPRYGVDMHFTSDVEQKVMQAYGEAQGVTTIAK